MKKLFASSCTIFVACIVFFFAGCKKDTAKYVAAETSPGKDGPIAPYVFAWDDPSTTYMPSTPANQIPMPWNGGTTAIDPNIVSDYKSSDGWQLVYNTFSPTTPATGSATPYFFALYNVYRGLLRFYLWQPPTAVATTYVNHGLSLYTTGTSSSMLNFDAVDVSEPNTNQSTFTEVAYQQASANGGTWYAFQYEIAYDPNIPQTTFPNFGLTWSSQYVSVTSLSATGSNTGTLTGDINLPNQNTIATVLGQVIGGALEVFGVAATGGAFQAAIGNALGNTISGFFSAIAGGNSNNTAEVDLSINSTITLTGSLVSSGGLENVKLPIPAQSNSQTADGNIPYFNNIMGVFNISNRPTIHESTTSSYWSFGYSSGYNEETSYNTIDNTSFSILWNPAIINSSSTGATIQNLREGVVVLSTVNLPAWTIQSSIGAGQDWYIGSYETVGKYYVYSSVPQAYQAGGSTSALLWINLQDAPVWSSYETPYFIPAVRISFDVVPNNGTTPVSHITRTFFANQVNG